jgi:hypothetical protein
MTVCDSAGSAKHVATLQRMNLERLWWGNVWRVLRSPWAVLSGLRPGDDEEADDDAAAARQEPVLLIVILAGIAGVLATPTADRLLDSTDFDGLLIAVWAFIGGLFYGFTVYMLGGLALWLGARGMGGEGEWRLARHLLAYSAVPVALSLFVLLPVRLLAFGGDTFRSGGSDAGGGGTAIVVAQLGFVMWSLALLVLGLRAVYDFSWGRAIGTLGLVALVVAAMIALPSSF